MSQQVIDYFNKLAESAIERCHELMAALKFYENVKVRLLSGEDLSSELASLRHVSQRDAVFVVNKLIQRCYDNMLDCWKITAGSGIESQVSYAVNEEELIPRFTAKYSTNTEVGAVTFILTSKGNHVDLDVDTESVKSKDTTAALREVSSLLLFARLQQK